jgi:class 3 adenylate cyclase
MSTSDLTLTQLGGRGRVRRLPHGVAYGAVVALFGAVYGVVVYSLTERWGVRGLAGSVQVFAIAFLLSLAIGIPLHVRVQAAVDRWLQARRRTADALHALFARLTTGVPVGPLVRRALEIVRTDVGLERATLFLLATPEDEFVPVATSGDLTSPMGLSADHALIEIVTMLRIEIGRATLRGQPRYAAVSAECLAAFDRLQMDLLFPIEVEGRVAGFLAVAGEGGLERLPRGELEVLRALSAEFSVCAARAQDEERIRGARLELERFARYLPRSLAKDLSDGRVPGERGRRRNVTAVACEIVGFDALADVADPTELAEALRRYHALGAAESRREGGSFAYARGERLMSVFGDPEAHADHALRALRAANRLVRDARQLWEPWRRQVPGLDVRGAVATGIALVGFFAVGTDLDYQIVGGPKDRADALLAEAAGGDVLLTDTTLAAAGAGVESEAVGAGVQRLVAVAGA